MVPDHLVFWALIMGTTNALVKTKHKASALASSHSAGHMVQGNEFIVVNTIGSLSCYSHESCGHVERLEWLAWFVLGYLNSFL